ncbi:manganese lipoxygenase [Magnaporthiopsis poae ATCC 64411]|uniref:Manganese lipoxygenase n=1 Tax=Magnaporthiopsis poae (strain ATCC 64411 / 73-15) TaxID=644358 RepID=A0A0C4DWZ0_MAGP6|nr:manganese lipoxygenase [Magnaporthiopsis poae ATCC 64411]
MTLEAIMKHGGIKTVDDFALHYDGQWKESVPGGIDKGIMSNYTSDLLFAMERLSNNPYLPFSIDGEVVKKLTGTTLEVLHEGGRLFVADHSNQKKYKTQAGRYQAACTGLFYPDAQSNQILPLAIKTNMSHVLFHVGLEIIHRSAFRSFSDVHPVMAVIDRPLYQCYDIRPVGLAYLFNTGGFFEQNFGLPASETVDYPTALYQQGAGAGPALPFHTAALYALIPTTKLAAATSADLLKWLPNEHKAMEQVGLLARFNRAEIGKNKERVFDAFSTLELLAAMARRSRWPTRSTSR